MPLIPGELTVGDNATPASANYDDIYYSSDGGLAQARAVFLQGCRLPQSWQEKSRFAIVETGFGLGLNFLSCWEAFRLHPGECQVLHFISVEKHPLARESLERCHAAWPELAELAQALRAQWPELVAGYHRLCFDGGRVQLTLIFDDVSSALKQLNAKADAFFLDGFSPAKNPEMWSTEILEQLGRIAKPNARLATWCVAGAVRQGLQKAGFLVERKPGFGRKKERLEAVFQPASRQETASAAQDQRSIGERSVTIIGAGIAGVSLAHALTRCGWQVTLIEKHSGPAQGASGNPAGVVRPQLAMDESFNGRLSRQAFLHTVSLVSALCPAAGANALPSHEFGGVLHLARTDEQAEHMPAMLSAHRYPNTFAQWVSQSAASDLAGMAVTAPGLYFPHGGWLKGAAIADALLLDCEQSLSRQFSRAATKLERTDNGWRVWEQDRLLADSAVVVLTGAHEAVQFANLPLTPVRGQITTLADETLPDLRIPVTRDGYVLPTHSGIGNVGASFAFEIDNQMRHDDQLGNLQRLSRLLQRPPALDASRLGARVSYRAATPDRMPLAGQLADEHAVFQAETPLDRVPRLPGLYTLSGLGARGLVWGPFLAQALAAKLDDEPWWLPQDLWQAIDPARFLLRKVRRGG